jgi:hypothetical protein
MPSTSQTIELIAGNNAVVTIPVLNPAGLAVDLVGASATWKMGVLHGGVNPTIGITKSTSDPTQMLIVDSGARDANAAIIYALKIYLRRADTLTLKPSKNYYHEADIVDAAGATSTVTTGTFILDPTLNQNSTAAP